MPRLLLLKELLFRQVHQQLLLQCLHEIQQMKLLLHRVVRVVRDVPDPS